MKPVVLTSLSEALANPDLLGAAMGDMKTWKAWTVILKAAFAEPLDEDELSLFKKIAGDREPPVDRVKELWVIAGRRGGKSRMAGAIQTHAASMQQYALAPGERGRALTLAVSKDQAGAVREYARGFLKASPVLQQMVVDDSSERISLKGGMAIEAHASSFRSVRGGTLTACVLDEIAFFRDETSAQPDKEIYRAIKPSLMTTGGMLIAISSPYRRTGLLFASARTIRMFW